MKKQQQGIFLFIGLFLCNTCFSQIIIDPTVETRYKDAVQKVPEEFQIIFKKKDEPGLTQQLHDHLEKLGFGIFTLHQMDTLNKEDRFPYAKGSIEITDIDTFYSSNKPKKYEFSDGSDTYLPIFMNAVLKNDSLLIFLPYIWEPQIRNIVTIHSVSAVYWDYRKQDSIFKLSANGPKINEIHLPMKTIRFSLSAGHYKAGDTVYGEVEQETPVFYEENPLYKSGYIQQRLHVKYVFQIIILSPEVTL